MTGKPARLAFLIIGGVLLLFAAWNFLVPRPHYSTSTPAPSTVLSTMPDAVSVQFTGDLAPESSISVVSTVTVSASGEKAYGDGKRFTATRGADARTLNVGLDSDLPNGLYWVSWSAVAARGRAKRFGNFCFSVGMPIPEGATRDRQGAVVEHDYQYREQRAVLVGGFLLVVLGLIIPLFSDSRGKPLYDRYSGM